MIQQIDRRSFVKASLLPAVWSLSAGWTTHTQVASGREAAAGTPQGPEIIDTNVHLFDWPFRRLKYARTGPLVEKLRGHRITQAWAGSFEAVLQKQLDGVNRRLAEECRIAGDGMLLPFGSVNPAWPDWEEDLRRCDEQHRMPGIRLYPGYHGYTLDHPEFVRLLAVAAQRGLLVQIAIRLEDERVHHPTLDAPLVDAAPLPGILKQVPSARVQLINSGEALHGRHVLDLVRDTQATFDIAAIEGNGGLGRLIDGTHPTYDGPVGVERLLFGSHAPYFPCESALMKLFESPLVLGQLQQLMRGNAERLLAV
ncbi:MAG TPA: amidohydrolase family protein [Rhodothermales bacterium]|nr:amidohydrolase family protein [Rhodothermales bacterium]